MKKQVKKLGKKILIYGLATSIIFTSCFSYKKINAHAASVAAGLSAYTLYEICLYIGGLAVTTLGIGYAYENRDEIAEFGKNIIDSMVEIPEQGWFFGATAPNGDPTIYGREALVAVQMAQWASIVLGGQSPQNNNNNDDDDESEEPEEPQEPEEPLNDYDKRTNELGFIKFFLTSAGLNLFEDTFKTLYDAWVNKEEDNILDNQFGVVDSGWSGYELDADGNYKYRIESYTGRYQVDEGTATKPVAFFCYVVPDNKVYTDVGMAIVKGGELNGPGPGWYVGTALIENGTYYFNTNLPILTSKEDVVAFRNTGVLNNVANLSKSFRVADWLADEEYWKGKLEDIALSLRSLQDLFAISQTLSDGALTTQPSLDDFRDMLNDLLDEYVPSTDPVTNPTYYPETNTTPKLDPEDLPNYSPSPSPDPGGGTEPPSGDGTEEPEIDLDGLLSIFNILFYLIMIIVMLIYLFLSCLAFIVMIFRIPASSTMLPEDMVLGYEHLKTIMIPGMNISIYGFAMALIYLFIIFAVIKLIRLEINDFKFPRSYK